MADDLLKGRENGDLNLRTLPLSHSGLYWLPSLRVREDQVYRHICIPWTVRIRNNGTAESRLSNAMICGDSEGSERVSDGRGSSEERHLGGMNFVKVPIFPDARDY